MPYATGPPHATSTVSTITGIGVVEISQDFMYIILIKIIIKY